LHHHTFFNMFFDGILETHCVWILSCSSLGASAWFISWPIFLIFWLSSPIFSIVFQTWFELPHLSIASLPNVCAHILSILWVSTFYVAPMATSAWRPIM
jgi:hypothetical protein